jgi:hypothetical protein
VLTASHPCDVRFQPIVSADLDLAAKVLVAANGAEAMVTAEGSFGMLPDDAIQNGHLHLGTMCRGDIESRDVAQHRSPDYLADHS